MQNRLIIMLLIITFYSYLIDMVSDNRQVDKIYADIKRAFVTVNIIILIAKLKSIGIKWSHINVVIVILNLYLES